MKSILIYDEHCGWSPSLNASKGTGGTEVHLVQIASWLADQSGEFAVAAMCHDGKGQQENGVWYHDSRCFDPIARFDVIVTVRKSAIPRGGNRPGTKVLTLVTDDPRPCPEAFAHLLGRSTLVCVSEWQASLYRALGHNCAVIPAMIDDATYGMRGSHDPHLYGCFSAWNKGTQRLLDEWPDLSFGTGMGLLVGSPYSEPDDAEERCRAAGAMWVGRLRPHDVVHELMKVGAHIRICDIEETFGATDAIARAVGCRVHVWCPNGEGALPETVPGASHSSKEQWVKAITFGLGPHVPKDYRVSTIMPMWQKLLEDV